MACKQFREHVHKDSIAISFSNGVNNSEVVRSALDAKVLDGCVYILAHLEKAGVIRKKARFLLLFLVERAVQHKLWHNSLMPLLCATKPLKIYARLFGKNTSSSLLLQHLQVTTTLPSERFMRNILTRQKHF
jgi:Ketopantoate reductase PanE/ApbA.